MAVDHRQQLLPTLLSAVRTGAGLQEGGDDHCGPTLLVEHRLLDHALVAPRAGGDAVEFRFNV